MKNRLATALWDSSPYLKMLGFKFEQMAEKRRNVMINKLDCGCQDDKDE